MSEDKIAEIRERHAQSDSNYIEFESTWDIHADRATLLAEVDRLRAEIERLCNEDTKTRHALGGWVWVCPDGGDEPTHERVAAVVAEVEKLRSEIERMRDVLRRVVVYPSGDKAARVAFVSVGCQVSFPLHPQTTGALELLVEFDQARRNALEGKP